MNRLKQLRKEKGLSQQDLAQQIGVHYRTLQNWEHGTSQISIREAKKLAEYFGVSIGYLLGFDDVSVNNGIADLIAKINHWADERNLKKADPKIQWMRITEEVGEIRDVLLKPTKFNEPQTALKDAIGDTLVTIIVLAHQLDLDVTECLNIAYEEIKNRKGKIVNGTFVKESDL
ncbi:helix-turn-helix domain-containing protein [Streptococcus thermophilus]|uniref:helix-turn-helix domain-containing protein n=1 Tax=Streptococcus thermophilus TaxID=1308 RepID=UPI002FDE5539